MTTPRPTVLVSGAFDLLHSGHVAFLQAAAAYGDLHVAVGSDRTVSELKGRPPVNSEAERLYMVKSVACVTEAFVSSGAGMLDFEPELRRLRPGVFVVNSDGNVPQKEALCRELGIDYVVLERTPQPGLPPRSTSSLREAEQMPYRLDLAGGWLDQPFVSSEWPGAVLTISLEPVIMFNERSGMATSTRNHALELWGPRLPPGDPERLAYLLFCYDNPPGTTAISGSQDAIGIVMPGLNRAHYAGAYWPEHIETIGDDLGLRWLEESLWLVPIGLREETFDPLEGRRITRDGARALADAASACWQAILARDVRALGSAVRASFEAQVAMFPRMVTSAALAVIAAHRDEALGWKLSGAGGGGYVVFVSEQPIPNAIGITIRRATDPSVLG